MSRLDIITPLQIAWCLQRSREWIHQRIMQNNPEYTLISHLGGLRKYSTFLWSLRQLKFFFLSSERWNHTPPRLGHSTPEEAEQDRERRSLQCSDSDSWLPKLSYFTYVWAKKSNLCFIRRYNERFWVIASVVDVYLTACRSVMFLFSTVGLMCLILIIGCSVFPYLQSCCVAGGSSESSVLHRH